ncbi:MAG: F0F1 ATP synthase subunit gamma [Magnetococcus sp. DMHC-6]
MANLKSLRLRIRSVKNTQQITKAMKMVAAAKLRRAQDRALATRPYSIRMGRLLQSVAAHVPMEGAPALLAGRGGEVKRVELVIFTADRGLCGSFNSGVIRSVRTKIAELQQQGKEVSLLFVGRKGQDVLKRQFGSLIRRVHIGVARNLNFDYAEREIAARILNDYHEGLFDSCLIVFNQFQSAMTQNLTWRQIIPVEVPKESQESDLEPESSYLFEPSDEEVLEKMLPKNVAVQIFQAMVESDASEHGARMTAMDNAVRNAGKMIRKLTTTFNRSRQAAITTELMEIIGGAESLKG